MVMDRIRCIYISYIYKFDNENSPFQLIYYYHSHKSTICLVRGGEGDLFNISRVKGLENAKYINLKS